MRTRIFGTLAGIGSGMFTAFVVIMYIADDMLNTAVDNLRYHLDGLTGKRPKISEEELREISAQAQAEFQAVKDLPPRPGIQHPVVSWRNS